MDSKEYCVICRSPLMTSDEKVTTSMSHEAEDQLTSIHRRCFVCSVCNSPLGEKKHKLMENKRFVCDKHESITPDGQNSDFLAVLRDFKRACLQVNEVVKKSDNGHYVEDKLPNGEICQSCNSHPFVVPKKGYWIECTDKNCPKLQGSLQLADKLLNSFRDLGSSGKTCTKVLPEEIYENYFYGSKHWNYYSRERKIGPVILTIKQEFRHSRDFFRIMVRSSLYVIHGMLPVTHISSSPYSHEEVVLFLSKEIGLQAQLKLINIPTAPTELLRIDKVFLKDEYKVGIIYMKEDQQTEEQLFNNEQPSPAFDEFLNLLGDRVRLRGFAKYRGGLDITNDLTGTHSVYTTLGNKQVMFHVSTLLPFEKKDTQKLQRKRHIGNDIACIVFLEATHTQFNPECIKSNFLHTYVVVQVDLATNPNTYKVAVVSRNQVPLYSPALTAEKSFEKGPEFRHWILNKVINGEIACHKAPNFAKLHQRTRCQLMEDLIETVEKTSSVARDKRDPLPFRERNRSSSRRRSSSPNQDVFQETFESSEQLAKDFSLVSGQQNQIADVRFIVGKIEKKTFLGVRAIMTARSSVFRKMLIDGRISPTESQSRSVSSGSNSPTSPRNTASWNITSSKLPGTSRSRKFSLKKTARAQSTGEQEVVLSSFSQLERTNENGKNGGKEVVLQEYTIEEFEPDVFEALLGYLHTGSCHITAGILPGLLCASQCYGIPEVQQVCVDSIEECLDDSTVYTALQSIDQYPGYPEIKRILYDKIGVFLEGVTKLNVNQTKHLSERSLKLVLSKVIKADQISKFKAIVEWSETCSTKHDCFVSIEELAKPLVAHFVDLSGMSTAELKEIVQPSGLVTNDKLMVVMATKADQNAKPILANT